MTRPLWLTAEEIDAAKSPRGGWTAATLRQWGIPWPAPKGWRQALLNGDPIPGSYAEKAERLRDAAAAVRDAGHDGRLDGDQSAPFWEAAELLERCASTLEGMDRWPEQGGEDGPR